MAENEGVSRFTPQHPLPKEIQAMERDETVCQYCGVSYLIHNEIKALEKKVKQMEDDVEEHKRCGENKQKQQEHINDLNRQKAELEGVVAAKKLLVEELQRQLKSAATENKKLQKDAELLQEQLKNAEMETNSVRKQMLPVKRLSRKLAEAAAGMHKELQELRSAAQNNLRQSGQLVTELRDSVTGVLGQAEQERGRLESQLRCEEMEKTMAVQNAKSLAQRLEEQGRQEQKAAEVARSRDQLHSQCQALETQITDLSKQVENLTKSNHQKDQELHQKDLELHQSQQNLKLKASEIQLKVSEIHQMEKDHESLTRKIQDTVLNKERELKAANQSLVQLRSRLEAQEQKNQAMSQESALSFNEVKQLQESLARARGDMEALKEEREAMIVAHQNRIEQLRESFKNKVEEADKWHAKMKEALAKENEKHSAEMKSLEEGLKQNFLLELQIEKDRYNELVKKYQAEQKEHEQKLRSEQVASSSHIQAELERKLRELRKESEATEASLRKEVASLKALIADLENRLGAVNMESSDAVTGLQARLRQTEEELEQTATQARQLQSTLENNKHEIMFLQDTVRKECEERFELTEALAAARKELLQLKRPAGGYPGMNGKVASDTALNLNSSSSSLSTKLHPVESPRGPTQQNPSPSKPPVPKPSPVAPPKRNTSPSANISVGFNGDQARAPGKLKGTNIEANRRRIAALLKRT